MKNSLLLLSLGLIGCVIFAWRQNSELRELRATALSPSERAEWQRRVRELENRGDAPRGQAAASEAGLGQAHAAAITSPAVTARETNRGPGRAPADERGEVIQKQTAAIKELMATPEVQAMRSAQRKASIDQRYAELFQRLHLPEDQVQKLTALLEERANTMQDLVAVAREQGINLRENPAAYKQLVTDTQNQLNESIKAVIGEDGFAQLSVYDKTGPQRSLVQDLAQRLSYTSNPLSLAQAEQLAQILAANPPARAVSPATSAASRPDAGVIVRTAMTTVPGVSQLLGGADDSGRPAIPGYPVTAAAITQAQTILSPTQLAALQRLQQQQQEQARLKTLVTETLVNAQPPAVSPPAPRKGG